jgi:uncharacterized protein YacL (UPF0231 family)
LKHFRVLNCATTQESTGKVVLHNFEIVGINYKVWLNGEEIANIKGQLFFNLSKYYWQN